MIQKLTIIFQNQNYPIPYGFTEDDVNLSSPKLFTDNYYSILFTSMEWCRIRFI
ncbi:DUF3231 family protein [Bacillus sp. AFS040349]|uniref:DUF3231 family protein n=1 Tax=Bacillus sp. AFS040349 TaxID=2033502 RepID=UPI000BFDE588|nr:hypothetical protein COD11_06005 [Bacillus sp. AFS040349]